MEMVEPNALPMPDLLEPMEESPYLRRQKSVPLRRSRVSRRVKWALFAVAVLLPVLLAGYAISTFALNSPLFVLASADEIVVTGNHFVSREEVLGVLDLSLTGNIKAGTNIFRISLEKKQGAVETLAWVHTATVTRILPHGLLVNITERTPVAYQNMNGRVSLVDEDGMSLEKPENGVFDFPVIYGLENLSSLDARRARMALYLDFIRQLGVEAPRSGWMVSEIYLADSEDLKALLISGQQTVQVHFGQKDFLPRFRNFLVLYPEILKSNGKLDSVDLRYKNQVVVDPQTSTPVVDGAAAGSGDVKD
jgi:cell division protein FtsQ